MLSQRNEKLIFARAKVPGVKQGRQAGWQARQWKSRCTFAASRCNQIIRYGDTLPARNFASTYRRQSRYRGTHQTIPCTYLIIGLFLLVDRPEIFYHCFENRNRSALPREKSNGNHCLETIFESIPPDQLVRQITIDLDLRK